MICNSNKSHVYLAENAKQLIIFKPLLHACYVLIYVFSLWPQSMQTFLSMPRFHPDILPDILLMFHAEQNPVKSCGASQPMFFS